MIAKRETKKDINRTKGKTGPKPYKPKRTARLRRLDDASEPRLRWLLDKRKSEKSKDDPRRISIDDLVNEGIDLLLDVEEVPSLEQIKAEKSK
jgi:hypothetical protein